MLTIGLTGGIGAGKSEVARLLMTYGAVLIDADRIAREVVEPGTSGLAEVVAQFGSEVLTADGALDRAAMARLVFGDERARRRLEAVVHPLVAQRTQDLLASVPPDAVVVHDVPLLVEKGYAARYDMVVVVEAPEDVRVDRLVEHRGFSAEDAGARIAAQATPAERAAVADVVIDNAGTFADLEVQVAELWVEVTSRLA
ncbi:MAG TPA: dephospho-CoA kinase [Actinomycetes bacterium]